VRMLGGVRASIQRALLLAGTVVIQIRGETKSIGEEAVEAAESGAKIVMVDTGSREDLEEATRALTARGLRSRVRVAFSGGITLDRIGDLSMLDADIIDVGYAILDAPCLSMRFDVLVSP
jgi:nicotinate-nucleotide pyrophosphorylase (carboxylating)